MTRSDLIDRIAQNQSQLAERDVELAVKMMLDHMAECLADGGRIETRGFGSFSLRFREASKSVGSGSRHRHLNIQTAIPNARAPSSRTTTSAVDPTGFDAS